MPQTISLLVVDDGTEIPIIATRTLGIGADFDLFKRSGYGTTQETQRGYVIVSPLDRLKETSCDPSSWTDRTMYVAHRALIDDFNVFVNGQTLDVRLVLGADRPAVVAPAGGWLDGGGSVAFVLDADGSEATRRAISTGRRNPDQVEVTAGLKPGERIVTSPIAADAKYDTLNIH